jgi:RimJ/RimL family protein N-acetyltransferase
MFPEITRDDVFRLETERLWLRWPRAADAAAFVKLAGDPEVALKTAEIPLPYGLHDAESFILRARAENAVGGGLSLVLSPKRLPNEAIGVIGAHGADTRGVATIGFWLGKPYWGQGFMGEAAAAFLDLIFGVTSLERVESRVMSANAASRRVHEKLGFASLGACLCPAPARGGEVPGELFRLGRGAIHTTFGARHPRFPSS